LSEDSPLWHIGKVKKLEYVKKENSVVDWFLTMEFETKLKQKKEKISEENTALQLRLGDYVELKDLVAAAKYNGSYGVVVSGDDFKRTGRYEVQARERLDEQEDGIHRAGGKLKHLSILPKNVSKFQTLEEDNDENNNSSSSSSSRSNKIEWTWKIHRLHPTTGGTLEGTVQDCAALLSLEWLEDPEPPSLLPETNFPLTSTHECQQWIGTSEYFLSTDGTQKYRIRWGLGSDANGRKVNGFLKWSFIEIRGNSSTSIKKCPISSFPRSETMATVSRRMCPNRTFEVGDKVWMISAFNRLIVEGRFTAEWLETSTIGRKQRLSLNFYIDDSGPEPALSLRKRQIISSFSFIYDEGKIYHGGSVAPTNSLSKCLTEIQQGYFSNRLTHWFFRQDNVMMKLKEIDLYFLLVGTYNFFLRSDINRSKEALDIAIMEADYCYNKYKLVADDARKNVSSLDLEVKVADADHRVAEAGHRVGAVLMALGRPQEAAEVFSETGDRFLPNRTDLYQTAAFAYQGANDFENAERQFVNAIYRSSDDISTLRDGLFSHMVFAYNYLSESSSNKESEHMFVTLSALIYAAGFESPQGEDQSPTTPYIQKFGRHRPRILKKKFLSRSKAMKRLQDASKSSNVQDFRASILFCKDQTCNVKVEPIIIPNFLNIKSEIKQFSKHELRKTNRVEESVRIPCGQCEEHCVERKQCPCEMVSYCSKDCQIAHWKIHKKDCTHRKPKSRK